ncbi:hypothetical protein BDF20DRAFT_917905 [Mycotypha africana]|uniref:uncharacterized protein n=1 Tax=Mycotypha africana TaxID=64632 RepID=UPI002301855A|nr:uncharacterized protein BDF20DRAFT_917905 [Mycotypha africana]KAI8967106.1 hypothetical protein BDF20DRAFT_917905 [Mycotypha africana]
MPFNILKAHDAFLYDSDCEEDIKVVEEDAELSIWEIWKQITKKMQTEEDVDNLEHLNVIQLGNNIRSEVTKKHYPPNLIEKTDVIIKDIPNFFVSDIQYYNMFFDTLVLNNEKLTNESLAEEHLTVFQSENPFMKFFYGVISTLVSEALAQNSDTWLGTLLELQSFMAMDGISMSKYLNNKFPAW